MQSYWTSEAIATGSRRNGDSVRFDVRGFIKASQEIEKRCF